MRVQMDRANLAQTTIPTETKEESKILSLIIIDNSLSMSGSKYYAALKGVHEIVRNITEEESIKLVQFSDKVNAELQIEYSDKNMTLEYLTNALNKSMSNTALYSSIIYGYKTYVLSALDKDKNTKVLINIFTDGEDNASTARQRKEVNDIISKLESEGHTVSFLGTNEDRAYILKSLKISESNLFTYSNDSKGVTRAFDTTLKARALYKDAVKSGEDVTLGFYSKVLDSE